MSERSINDLPEGYVPAVELKENYKPLKKEEYMCDEHIEYFRRLLVQWQEDLIEESQETINNLQGEVRDIGDEAERASRETENTLELRTRDRYRKLLSKIRKTLTSIQDGDYGYCEESGEEIGLNRLMARPIATMTIDVQERWELRQKLIKEGR
jgi:DnaK suppressor protein